MERCPLCRARLTEQPVCPRCGADLGLAQTAEIAASRWRRDALAALANGDRHSAAQYARTALYLHRTPVNETLATWLGQ